MASPVTYVSSTRSVNYPRGGGPSPTACTCRSTRFVTVTSIWHPLPPTILEPLSSAPIPLDPEALWSTHD